MTLSPHTLDPARIRLSIGILAWNEEDAIRHTLESLFLQSIFYKLSKQDLKIEILLVANGCTDRTLAISQKILEHQSHNHPFRKSLSCRVVDIPERGKLNAWNRYVHQLSARAAEFLFLMDSDILLDHPDTLWNMWQVLENNPKASVATDLPLKDISFKKRKSLREKISLATSRMTQTAGGQLSGQLYCIRAAVARNIYLPRDLAACEDGFIKMMVCTYFLTREAAYDRIIVAHDASHIFQAYTSLTDILRNQKRQMIGQTIVHILVDNFLKKLSLEEKLNLAETLQDKESFEPDWLKPLISAHIRRTRFFWRLFPNLLDFRFRRLALLKGPTKLLHFPAAVAGFAITLISCWLAHRSLKQGSTDYWPDTKSQDLKGISQNDDADDPLQQAVLKSAM